MSQKGHGAKKAEESNRIATASRRNVVQRSRKTAGEERNPENPSPMVKTAGVMASELFLCWHCAVQCRERVNKTRKTGTYAFTTFLTTLPSFALNRGIMFLNMIVLWFSSFVSG